MSGVSKISLSPLKCGRIYCQDADAPKAFLFNPMRIHTYSYIILKRLLTHKGLAGVDRVLLIWATVAVVGMLMEYGFMQSFSVHQFFEGFYAVSMVAFCMGLLLRFLIRREIKLKRRKAELVLLLLMAAAIGARAFVEAGKGHDWGNLLHSEFFYPFFLAIFALVEISKESLRIYRLKLSPAILFVASFLVLILTGALLLLLPGATTQRISLTDAFFTATSAVSVTGLVVVDTGETFTYFGKMVILVLIQFGGLGIMTFTSFFAFFFKGNASDFQSFFMVKEYVNAEKLNDAFKVVLAIIYFTFLVEALGTVLIFVSLEPDAFPTYTERVFFSLFHAVSAFCNAGFSTFSDSLYDHSVRYNYALQMVVACLFILGGLGFAVVLNLYRAVARLLGKRFRQLVFQEVFKHQVSTFSLNSRIALYTTLGLLVLGCSLFGLLEYNNTLAEHQGTGKWVVAFFGGATPRTAGFNGVDMSALAFPTILLYIFLMWVGASPGSTGGGIKTSTFALAVLNILSVARGKERVELQMKEIAIQSIKRAFAIMALSIFVIGIAIYLVSVTDPGKPWIALVFECVSAFSTVGLSLGITGELSTLGKIVIMVVMFVGRVGTLTILIGMLAQVQFQSYQYPEENIMIN